MAEQGGVNSQPPKLPPKHSAPSFREKKDVLGRANLEHKPVPKPRSRSKLVTSPQGDGGSKVLTSPDRPVPKPRPRNRTQSLENICEPTPYLESDLDSVQGKNATNDPLETASGISDGIYSEATTDDVYVNYKKHEISEESAFRIPIDAEEAGKMVEDMVNAQFANSDGSCNTAVFGGQEQPTRNSSGNGAHSKNIPVQRVEAFQRMTGQKVIADTENSSVNRKGKSNIAKQPIYDIQEFLGNRPENPQVSGSILVPDKVSPIPALQELIFVPGKSNGSPTPDIQGEDSVSKKMDATSSLSPGDNDDRYEPVWFPDKPRKTLTKPDRSDLLIFSPDAKHGSPQTLDSKTPRGNVQTTPRPLIAAAEEPPSRSRDTVTKLNIVEQWGEYAKLDPNSSLCYEQPPPMYAPPPLPVNVFKNVAPPVPPRPGNDPHPTVQAGSNAGYNWNQSGQATTNTGSSLNQTGWAEFDPVSSSEPGSNASYEAPPPSAIFKELDTPQGNFFQEDPFKYSEFAVECDDFNKVSDLHSATQQQDGGALSPLAAADSTDFDPFNVKGEQVANTSQVSWTSSTSSGSSEQQRDPIRMSMVPPPPHQQSFGRQNVPRDNLYSLAVEGSHGELVLILIFHVFVLMCVYVYVCVYVCMCVCIHTYTHTYIHIYIYIHIFSSPSNSLKPNLCQCVDVYVCIVKPDIQTIHRCSHTSIYIHIHTYIHTHIHIYLFVCLSLSVSFSLCLTWFFFSLLFCFLRGLSHIIDHIATEF